MSLIIINIANNYGIVQVADVHVRVNSGVLSLIFTN